MNLASNRFRSDHLAWVHYFSNTVVDLRNVVVFILNWLRLHNSLLELVFRDERNELCSERAKLAVSLLIRVPLFVFIF